MNPSKSLLVVCYPKLSLLENFDGVIVAINITTQRSLEEGKPASYDARGLPYPESSMTYHRYEVTKDINLDNLKEGFEKMNSLDREELSILMDKYEFSLSDMANPQKGRIAEVFGSGGGMQIKFETSVEWYEKLGILKEMN